MAENSNHKSIRKGMLSAEFGRTSVGTTPQDEKNILLESPKGEAMYLPRSDTYAYTANERSKRSRLDRKRKQSFQQLLFMINQLHRSIENELADISTIIDEYMVLNEKMLDFINGLNDQIDSIQHDHQYISELLDQSRPDVLNTQIKNHHINAVLNRYHQRTGREVNEHSDLKIILMSQIGHEQAITIPELKQKIENTTLLYDETINQAQDFMHLNDQLKIKYDRIRQSENNEEKLKEMNELHDEVSQFKNKAQKSFDEFSTKFGLLMEGYSLDHENSSIEPNSNYNQSVDLKKFGLVLPKP